MSSGDDRKGRPAPLRPSSGGPGSVHETKLGKPLPAELFDGVLSTGTGGRPLTEPLPGTAPAPGGPLRRDQETVARARIPEPSAPHQLTDPGARRAGPDQRTSAVGQEAMLVISDGPDRGTFPLTAGEVVIGRGRGCDVRVTRSSVSRAHACFSVREGRYVVRDLGSRTGTWVNGVRIEGDVPLHDADELRFGQLQARVLGPGLLPDRHGKPPQGAVPLHTAVTRHAAAPYVPPAELPERPSQTRWLVAGAAALLVLGLSLGALLAAYTRR